MLIAETGCVERGGDKARWIRAMFADVRRHRQVRSVVWFDARTQADWRLATSPAAARAFARSLRGFAPTPVR